MMNIKPVLFSDLSHKDLKLWSSIQLNSSVLSSPYFCPEFTQAVASVRSDVMIGLICVQGEVVGFFPFQRGRNGVGKPIGGPLSDYQAVITLVDNIPRAEDMLRGCGLSVWIFDHFITAQTWLSEFRHTVHLSPIINLENGYGDYLEKQRENGSKIIKEAETKKKKIEKEFGALRFEYNSTSLKNLELLLKWKGEKFLATGGEDVFREKWINDLIHRIVDTQTESFSGVVSTLYVNDVLIAGHIGMKSSTTLHWWFPSYNHKYSKFSPGTILLNELAKVAGNKGIQIIDLGKGDEIYKKRFSNDSIEICEGVVELPSLVTVARKLFRRLESVIRSNFILTAIAQVPGRFIKRWLKNKRYK